MTDLREHASNGGPEIVLTSDLPQQPAAMLTTGELVSHDQVTPSGSFPEHGQFLQVRPRELGESGAEWAEDLKYWECCSSLAELIVEELQEDEDGAGIAVDVSRAVKDSGGRWVVDGTVFEPEEE